MLAAKSKKTWRPDTKKNGVITKSQSNRNNKNKKKNMKKITLLLLSCSNLAAFSQAIPNSGFETWINNTELPQAHELPQGWISGDMINTKVKLYLV